MKEQEEQPGKSALNEKGRIQNPNETNAPENAQEKVQNNEPGSLEREGAENNAHNQNEEDETAETKNQQPEN